MGDEFSGLGEVQYIKIKNKHSNSFRSLKCRFNASRGLVAVCNYPYESYGFFDAGYFKENYEIEIIDEVEFKLTFTPDTYNWILNLCW